MHRATVGSYGGGLYLMMEVLVELITSRQVLMVLHKKKKKMQYRGTSFIRKTAPLALTVGICSGPYCGPIGGGCFL